MTRLATLVGTLLTLAAGTDVPAGLVVESTQSSLNGSSLSTTQFGSMMNGIVISDTGSTFYYDTSARVVFQTSQTPSESFRFNLVQLGNDLMTMPGQDSTVKVNNDSYLSVNDSSDVFYACSNLTYGSSSYTSQSQQGVGVFSGDAPSGCTQIQIRVDGASSSSSSPSGGAGGSTNGTAGGANSTTAGAAGAGGASTSGSGSTSTSGSSTGGASSTGSGASSTSASSDPSSSSGSSSTSGSSSSKSSTKSHNGAAQASYGVAAVGALMFCFV